MLKTVLGLAAVGVGGFRDLGAAAATIKRRPPVAPRAAAHAAYDAPYRRFARDAQEAPIAASQVFGDSAERLSLYATVRQAKQPVAEGRFPVLLINPDPGTA